MIILIHIEIDGKSILITDSTGKLYTMNWAQFKDLEKAIAAIRKIEQTASFDKMSLSLP